MGGHAIVRPSDEIHNKDHGYAKVRPLSVMPKRVRVTHQKHTSSIITGLLLLTVAVSSANLITPETRQVTIENLPAPLGTLTLTHDPARCRTVDTGERGQLTWRSNEGCVLIRYPTRRCFSWKIYKSLFNKDTKTYDPSRIYRWGLCIPGHPPRYYFGSERLPGIDSQLTRRPWKPVSLYDWWHQWYRKSVEIGS